MSKSVSQPKTNCPEIACTDTIHILMRVIIDPWAPRRLTAYIT